MQQLQKFKEFFGLSEETDESTEELMKIVGKQMKVKIMKRKNKSILLAAFIYVSFTVIYQLAYLPILILHESYGQITYEAIMLLFMSVILYK